MRNFLPQGATGNQGRGEGVAARRAMISPAGELSWTVPAPWTPADLSNKALWLDAADSGTITLSGSAVSQWHDKSGNSRNFASSARAAVLHSSACRHLPGDEKKRHALHEFNLIKVRQVAHAEFFCIGCPVLQVLCLSTLETINQLTNPIFPALWPGHQLLQMAFTTTANPQKTP